MPWMPPRKEEHSLGGNGQPSKTVRFTLWPDTIPLYSVHFNTRESNMKSRKEQRTWR
jgi:hypothetical protein